MAFINSKFNSFLMIHNTENSKFQLCHKGESKDKSLWKIEDFHDINKLNGSAFWIKYTSNKNKQARTFNQGSSESVYIVGVSDKDNLDLKVQSMNLKNYVFRLIKILLELRLN